MPKRTSSRIPAGAHLIRTYKQLNSIVDRFAHHEIDLVIVVGRAGTGKSMAVRERLPDAEPIYGGARPYSFYVELYDHRDQDLILDDADKVWRYQDGVTLLKQVTDSTPVRTVQWRTLTPEIRSGEVPRAFTTTSRVLILANSWPQQDAHIEAIESRGQLFYFGPSYEEMHKYAKTFVEDTEVYEAIGENLSYFESFDLRLYHKTTQVKATALRTKNPQLWRTYLQDQMFSGENQIVVELLRDQTFTSHNQRAREWHRLTGHSERTFYRIKDNLLQKYPDLVPAKRKKAV